MPTIKAKVIEGMTGDPLPNASVMIVDANGKSLGQGVAAGSDGAFQITSDLLLGNYLVISYAGLESVLVKSDMLNDTDYTEIDLLPKGLPSVVVTPNKMHWWWLYLLGGIILYRVTRKPKRNG